MPCLENQRVLYMYLPSLQYVREGSFILSMCSALSDFIKYARHAHVFCCVSCGQYAKGIVTKIWPYENAPK